MPDNPASVLLINPPITKAQREGPLGLIFKNLYFNSPPLGIATIAAVLERDGHRVGLLDAAVEEITLEETIERVRKFAPEVIGVTSTTNFSCNAIELAEKIRESFPGITIVLGGPHASAYPESCLSSKCFDYVCIGEGEITLPELLACLKKGGNPQEVKGLAFVRDGKNIITEKRPFIEDLDSIPMPARHLLPIEKYIPMPNDGPYLPKTAMVSSRGCPFHCIFCDHGVYGHSYRSESPKRIVDEMEVLKNKFGMNDIAFVDSLFMISVKRVTDICDEIIRRGLKIHWTCTTRANIATRQVFEKMKEAGCWRVRIGIESGNDEVLKFIRKELNKDQVRRVVADADALGLHPKGFFMVGHPIDTKETVLETIEFAKSLPLTDVTVQVNTPMPGTTQWDIVKDHGNLITSDFEDYTYWEPVFVPRNMTREELNDLHRKFYRSFYLRPIIVWRHLKMLRKISDIRRYGRALAILLSMFILKRRKGKMR